LIERIFFLRVAYFFPSCSTRLGSRFDIILQNNKTIFERQKKTGVQQPPSARKARAHDGDELIFTAPLLKNDAKRQFKGVIHYASGLHIAHSLVEYVSETVFVMAA